MVVLIAVCLDIYIMGFMTFLPKYIELHFGKTASFASLLTGATSILESFLMRTSVVQSSQPFFGQRGDKFIG